MHFHSVLDLSSIVRGQLSSPPVGMIFSVKCGALSALLFSLFFSSLTSCQ